MRVKAFASRMMGENFFNKVQFFPGYNISFSSQLSDALNLVGRDRDASSVI